MRDWARRLARWLFGDYQIYRIYEYDLADLGDVETSSLLPEEYRCGPVSTEDVRAAADEGVRSRAFYGGDGALAFAVYRGGEIVCLQWYWFGDRYRRRNFWPLKDGEAKSVELYTVPAQRGQGLATVLKIYSAREMKKRGFHRLFSRIWHSHTASCRVSEKAGWRNIAVVAECNPLAMKKKLRWVRRL